MPLYKHTHLKRYLQIADILARHGLGYFGSVLNLDRFLPRQRGWKRRRGRGQEQPATKPEHVRMALEEMGASAIKLGQILSTRADLLPPEYQAELAKLQDSALPVPTAEIRAIITREMGRPVEELYAEFDPEPLAAASIGQVHTARLHDGTEVVVKVRRPGVVKQIDEDLEIFEDLAVAASRRWEMAQQYDVTGLAREFSETLRTELDYVREGHSAERIARNFKGYPQVHIPRIIWGATSSRVLTMERIHGIKINDLDSLVAAGIDLKDLARRAADVILKMVFEDGYFHADPHPGNLFIEPDGTIAFIDFGMVGSVDEEMRNRTVGLILAMTSKDPDRLTDAFIELGVARQRIDRRALRQDLQHLEANYVDRALKEIQIGQFLNDSLTVVRRHHIQLPKSLALILKMGVMVEGIGVQLDPDFNLMAAIRPHGDRLMRERYSPGNIARRLGRASLDSLELSAELPMQLRRMMQEWDRGNLEIGVRPTEFEPIMERLEQLINRLVLGVLAAAFIVSLAVLMQYYHPPGWEDWGGVVFGFAFVLALILGVYLAWTIARGPTEPRK